MELCRIVSRMWRNCRREEARERWGIEMTSAAANTDAFSAAASNFLQNLPQHFVFISLLFITSQPDWRHQLGQYWESESDDNLMLLFPSRPPNWEFALQTKNSQLSPSRLVLDQMSKVERNLTFARRGNLGMMKNNGFVKLNLYCMLSRLIACTSILSGFVLSSANWITRWLCKWLTLVTGIIYMDRTDQNLINLPACLAMPGVYSRQL